MESYYLSRMGSDQTHRGRRGLVVSDLHLFSRRSEGAIRFDGLQTELKRSEVLVLNGDTFDFRWSALRDMQTTLAAAVDWLRGVMVDHPRCEVHFVAGNHDCLSDFQDRLTALAESSPRFQVHEYSLRLGSSLFVHGDCTHRAMDAKGLSRFRQPWRQDRQRGALAAAAYCWADLLGFTRIVHGFHFPAGRTVELVAHYLDRSHPGWRSGTLDCYFGHTHRPFRDHAVGGVTFHNTGSAIRGMGFNPIFFAT